jgi:methanethiol S-methyltransferase
MTDSGFFWIVLATLVYGGAHSLLASLQAKSLAGNWLGERFRKRWYRLFFNAAGIVTLAPVLALMAALPDQHIYTISLPWALFTLALQGIAGMGAVYAVYQTGASSFLGFEQVLHPETSDYTRPLATGGLYRYVRHPIYTCSLVLLWLTPVMTWNLLGFNLGATLYFVIGALFEERKLVKEHGGQYEDYRRRVPMLVPGLKLDRDR